MKSYGGDGETVCCTQREWGTRCRVAGFQRRHRGNRESKFLHEQANREDAHGRRKPLYMKANVTTGGSRLTASQHTIFQQKPTETVSYVIKAAAGPPFDGIDLLIYTCTRNRRGSQRRPLHGTEAHLKISPQSPNWCLSGEEIYDEYSPDRVHHACPPK